MNQQCRNDRKSGDAQVAGISRSPLLRLPMRMDFLSEEKNPELLLAFGIRLRLVRSDSKRSKTKT
jgi:hypothetical protein